MKTIQDFVNASKHRDDGGENTAPWYTLDQLIRRALPKIGLKVQAPDVNDIVQILSMEMFMILRTIETRPEEEKIKCLQTSIHTWIKFAARYRNIDVQRSESRQKQVGLMKLLFGLSRVSKTLRESIFQDYKKPFGPGIIGGSRYLPGDFQTSEDAQHDYLADEEIELLYASLKGTNKLKDYEKRIVLLRYIERRSWEEIIAIVQAQFPSHPPLKDSAWRKRLSRAVKKLRSVLLSARNPGHVN